MAKTSDKRKTKAQLIEELQRLRQQVAELRELGKGHERPEETAHSQRLLLALSQSAQAVQRARTPEEVYRTVGDEVVSLGYHAVILSLSAVSMKYSKCFFSP